MLRQDFFTGYICTLVCRSVDPAFCCSRQVHTVCQVPRRYLFFIITLILDPRLKRAFVILPERAYIERNAKCTQRNDLIRVLAEARIKLRLVFYDFFQFVDLLQVRDLAVDADPLERQEPVRDHFTIIRVIHLIQHRLCCSQRLCLHFFSCFLIFNITANRTEDLFQPGVEFFLCAMIPPVCLTGCPCAALTVCVIVAIIVIEVEERSIPFFVDVLPEPSL